MIIAYYPSKRTANKIKMFKIIIRMKCWNTKWNGFVRSWFICNNPVLKKNNSNFCIQDVAFQARRARTLEISGRRYEMKQWPSCKLEGVITLLYWLRSPMKGLIQLDLFQHIFYIRNIRNLWPCILFFTIIHRTTLFWNDLKHTPEVQHLWCDCNNM